MHRSGLIAHNIRKQVRRSDFYFEPSLRDATNLTNSVQEAVQLLADPIKLAAKISYGNSGGKAVARASDHATTIALRMINRGISEGRSLPGNRDDIVLALKAIISEQVPFSIIKLDVRGFYESFNIGHVHSHIGECREISPTTRVAIKSVVDNHITLGHSGLPRGLVISPTLADSLMRPFDEKLLSTPSVFFYRRFVDDIVIVMDSTSSCAESIKEFEKLLPDGLQFKESKNVSLSFDRCSPKQKAVGKNTKYLPFNYLGYTFHVASLDHNYRADETRDVWLDVAKNKVIRTKSRIMKSYIDFIRTGDFSLLERRIRHLTSNISIRDRSKGITRLSGIHYNYPLVDLERSTSLRELDRFLVATLHSTKGRVFYKLSKKLSPPQRQLLLRNSFFSGAKHKRFYQFNAKELGRIQRCWKHD